MMKSLREYQSVVERRKALEKELKVDLGNTGKFSLDENIASTRHCENMIGVTQIPLGVAGPLKLQTSNPALPTDRFKPRTYYVPLATTEGALVASVNRGCKAVTASGGATVAVEQVGATRGPVFETAGLQQGLELKRWIEEHIADLNGVAIQTSSHIKLDGAQVSVVGRHVYVRFIFDTQDAMGMNMVTIATQKMAQEIEKLHGVSCSAVAGNFDVDKKPSWLNFINGRGKKVWAEAIISHETLTTVLKTTAAQIHRVWLAKCLQGSALSGSMGYNCHFANVVAALFAATGQDLAQVVEGSLGITMTEVINRQEQGKNIQDSRFRILDSDLYVSIYMPDVMVGTVGGGTGLSTQKEALSILGLAGGKGGNNAIKFAEVLGAAVLAGELSLLASLAQGTLAQAHERLARNKNDKC